MSSTHEAVAKEVLEYYQKHGRHDMLWRRPEHDGNFNAYKILVSEIMLQQTQVNRVTDKYRTFLITFPTVSDLARASFSEILALWVGLGYNRRAKYLYEAAKALAPLSEPWSYEDLIKQKGIGPNTAAAVLTYAYDEPFVFIETNIRTVIIHHYFAETERIDDKKIISTLQRLNETAYTYIRPRQWYWALMDYGAYLKATQGNLSRKGKAYKKQSKFDGSRRQVRGKVIRLLSRGPQSYDEISRLVDDERFADVLDLLIKEKMVKLSHNTLMLYNE